MRVGGHGGSLVSYAIHVLFPVGKGERGVSLG